MTVFKSEKSSNDILNNGTISDGEVVACNLPLQYLVIFPWENHGHDSGIIDKDNKSNLMPKKHRLESSEDELKPP